jgi:hypothetical protein
MRAGGVRALMRSSWPARFAIVQFPNPPLIAALLAGLAGDLTDGTAHRVALAVYYPALSIWAYEEAVHGENWFRRLLGLGFAAYILSALSGALRA